MKNCKRCGMTIGFVFGDYCGNCYERLSLRDKVIEDIKKDTTPYQNKEKSECH